jgi:hypothetical protein
MARARRAWSVLRAEVRNLLRETVTAESFWTDAELLVYVNQALDMRVMELAEQHEGWVTDAFTANIVANQVEYTLQEGIGRVKRVVMIVPVGDDTIEVPLRRAEHWDDAVYKPTVATTDSNVLPTYRLMGNLLMLEPPPTTAVTAGLRCEFELAPDRLTADDSKIAARFPNVMETLLIYDTWDIALGVEDAQGNVDEQIKGRLSQFHRKYESMFHAYTAERSFGKSFVTPYYLGD